MESCLSSSSTESGLESDSLPHILCHRFSLKPQQPVQYTNILAALAPRLETPSHIGYQFAASTSWRVRVFLLAMPRVFDKCWKDITPYCDPEATLYGNTKM